MKSTRAKIILALIVLTATVLACTLPGGGAAPQDGDTSEQAVATAVAATLAAAEGASDTAQPVPSPTWTIHPTVTASPPEPDIVFQGISFSFDDRLADSVNAEIVPAWIDEGGGVWSYPEHVMITFNDYLLPDSFLDPRIKVYKVSEFAAVNAHVGERINTLQDVIASQNVDHDGIGVPEIFNAAQFFRAKVSFINFQNGQGVRFLTQYGQAVYPVGWPQMFYTYQGLTDDGQYYISAILPANHPSLPHPNDVVMDEAFMNNYETYLDQNVTALNGHDDSTFNPSLILLDEVIASLSVQVP